MASLYRTEAPGDWGVMQSTPGGVADVAILKSPGRPDIFYRYWRSGAPTTLLFMHGLGAHSGWFIDMGNVIASRGVDFYAMDHHGFGRSGGHRGHTSDWRTYLTDIDHVIDQIRAEQPNTKIFLLGHSMGGVFATHYAAAHQDKLTGLLMLNPWIADTTKAGLGSVASVVLGGLVGSKQILKLPREDTIAKMSANPEVADFLGADTYWVYERTKSFYWQITQMRASTLARAAKITIPALVLQAENDKSVVPAATKRAFDQLGSQDKTLKTYPEIDHDSQFSQVRAELDDDVVGWVTTHSA